MLSEHLLGILAGDQHSALVVVVACFHSVVPCIITSSKCPSISLSSFVSSGRVWVGYAMTTYTAGHVLRVCPSFTGSVVVEAVFLDLSYSYALAWPSFVLS